MKSKISLKIYSGCFILLCCFSLPVRLFSQTSLGTEAATMLNTIEYYNHTESEWIKIFRIYNHNANMGVWGKGGVSGRVYFVDYQGEGGSYIDFSFPQYISEAQLPVLTLSGNSADDISWYAQKFSDDTGHEYYDVFIKTPAHHLGLTFLFRGADYDHFGSKVDQPSGNIVWSSVSNQKAITFFSGNGNVGLGTLSPAEKLSVNGNIRAKEVKVETANWPDYVFSESYETPDLSAIESYIQANKHLPEIPSADDVSKGGINLGEMNSKLLKKIEELTLYMIEKDKQVNDLSKMLREQSRQISDLKGQLDLLKQLSVK
ncbi:SlyX family protein [Pararcticibacter amylolyticus]|nr:SlyX family protein [Pararcticibacter amylolyticus]